MAGIYLSYLESHFHLSFLWTSLFLVMFPMGTPFHLPTRKTNTLDLNLAMVYLLILLLSYSYRSKKYPALFFIFMYMYIIILMQF